jgi:hypothetical protein
MLSIIVFTSYDMVIGFEGVFCRATTPTEESKACLGGDGTMAGVTDMSNTATAVLAVLYALAGTVTVRPFQKLTVYEFSAEGSLKFCHAGNWFRTVEPSGSLGQHVFMPV